MAMKKLILATVATWQLSIAGESMAQTFDHLRIDVTGLAVQTDGGERRSAGHSVSVIIGRADTGAMSKTSEVCGLGASSRVRPDAVAAWTYEVTPIRVVDDAVTFRLRWLRSRDRGKESTAPGGDVELTLRPGQSLPIDFAEVPPTGAEAICAFTRAELRVSVDYNPRAQDDRRLVAIDLWLVQQLADGTKKTEPLSVRGQFYRPIPFYFSTLTDAGVWVDLFGEITVRPRDGSNEVLVETRSRLVEGDKISLALPMPRQVTPPGGGPPLRVFGSRSVESTLRLKADDVVSIGLPRLTENEAGAFANQALSITLRARVIR
jgi:hypothetical protein